MPLTNTSTPPLSRVASTFARIKGTGRPGLVTYVTAGDPDLAHSREILLALSRAGADVLEGGVPFSGPRAARPLTPRASERALAAGATLPLVLELVASVRGHIKA